VTPLEPMSSWQTPDGVLVAYVGARYTGLRDQPRICLVDRLGRVHHYDEHAVRPAPE
jgi:hypothetical protein